MIRKLSVKDADKRRKREEIKDTTEEKMNRTRETYSV